MAGRVGKWLLLATAGMLLVGVLGLGVVYAQGPNPERTPQAGCPLVPRCGAPGWRWAVCMVQTWADALGMKVEDLTAALREGETVAELAEAQGVKVEDLVAKAVAARKDVLQQAVEEGRLTQEQADALLEQMQERMTENLQNGTCAPGMGRGWGYGQGRGCWRGIGRWRCR